MLSGAIKAGTSAQSLRANRALGMNLAEARQPLTFSSKPPWGAAPLLSSSFCPTLPDLLCLPSASHPFISSLQLSAHKLLFFSSPRSIHTLSFPSIHGPNRAIDSSAGRDRIVLECEDEKGRNGGEYQGASHQGDTEKPRVVLRSTRRTEDRGINMGPTFCALQDICTVAQKDSTLL